MRKNETLHISLDNVEFTFESVIDGFKAEHLLSRINPKSNHLAWILGHAIVSEKAIVEMAKPESLLQLPENFAVKHSSETAVSNDRNEFYTLEEYLKIYSQMRTGTRKIVDELTSDDLKKKISEDDNAFFKTGEHAILFISQHWFWHIGQITELKKYLGIN